MNAQNRQQHTVKNVAVLETGNSIAAIVPGNTGEVFQLAGIIVSSGMAPKGMNTPEQAAVAILTGMEVGLSPIQSVNAIAVINGRPTMWGDAVLALVQGSGLLIDIEEKVVGEGQSMKAVCRVDRKSRKTATVREFSYADAQKANILNNAVWKTYPKRMMQMRARSMALRDCFPDVLSGIHMREEVQDYKPLDEPTTAGEPITISELSGETQAEEAHENEDITDADIVEEPDTDGLTPEEATQAIMDFTNATTKMELKEKFVAIRDRIEAMSETPLKIALRDTYSNSMDAFKQAEEAEDDTLPGDTPMSGEIQE